MIFALLAGGLLAIFVAIGSDGPPLARPDVLRERIEEHVSDEQRAHDATSMVDGFERSLRKQLEAQDDAMEALAEALEQPDTQRADLERLLAEAQATERDTIEEILELREQLKRSLTDVEWPLVFTIAPPRDAPDGPR